MAELKTYEVVNKTISDKLKIRITDEQYGVLVDSCASDSKYAIIPNFGILKLEDIQMILLVNENENEEVYNESFSPDLTPEEQAGMEYMNTLREAWKLMGETEDDTEYKGGANL